MNINNLNSLYGNVTTSSLSALSGVTPAATSGSPSSIPPAGAAATASISTPGQFFSEMQQLSQQDPAEFKAVAAKVSAAMQTAAGQTSGPQATFLTHLANQFSQAAQTGTLQPPQGAPAVQGTTG